jgi:transglutaminase-like putative cysteine protease
VRYQVVHKTIYDYYNAVGVSHHVLRLTPRALERQRTESHQLAVEPRPALTTTQPDYFGNPATFITVESPHRQLTVTASSVIEVTPALSPPPGATPSWESVRDELAQPRTAATREMSEFCFPSPLIPRRTEYAHYAAESFAPGRPLLAAGADLMRRIFTDFKFDPKATTVATPLDQVFQRRRGVCQDFAHLQIACLRSLGLAARYVSGYLETAPPPGKPKLVGADASHAWLQLWTGSSRWVDLDPTNNVLPTDRHIVLGWGRDFGDVSPLRGVLVGSGHHELQVAVDVIPLPAPAE